MASPPEAIRSRIRVLVGDITQLTVDAIVNAANESLLGGGGVDGAIHRAAGPYLLAECRTLNGCETGQSKMTRGYRLPARHVIHTVGPIFEDGHSGEPALLASCYATSLMLAADARLASIAFPCVSTGIFGYPKADACATAVRVVGEWLGANEFPREVIFCCFGEADAVLYRRELGLEK